MSDHAFIPGPAVRHVHGGAAAYLPGDGFGPRRLNDYEFVWITAGSATYIHDGHAVNAEPGTVILGRPGFQEQYRWDPRHTSRHLFFHFTLDNPPPDLGDARHWPVVSRMVAGDPLRPLFRHVLDAWCRRAISRHDEPPPSIARAILTMIDLFIHASSGPASPDHAIAPPPVVRAIDWITAKLQRRPDAAICLDDLADAAKVNPSHLNRLFRAALNHPPMRVVQLMKLEQAMTLLERSNLDVKEVAQRCGFASQFHFSRVFRRAYGQPPTALRDQMRAGHTRPTSPLPIDTPQIEP